VENKGGSSGRDGNNWDGGGRKEAGKNYQNEDVEKSSFERSKNLLATFHFPHGGGEKEAAGRHSGIGIGGRKRRPKVRRVGTL